MSAYGVFHISIILFIESMLMYQMLEGDPTVMTMGVYVGFFFLLLIVAVLSQYLSDHVRMIRRNCYNCHCNRFNFSGRNVLHNNNKCKLE